MSIIMTNHEYGSMAINTLYRQSNKFNDDEARKLLIKFFDCDWIEIKSLMESGGSIWQSWYMSAINAFIKWDNKTRKGKNHE